MVTTAEEHEHNVLVGAAGKGNDDTDTPQCYGGDMAAAT
jgi:hypothetical protein